MIVTVAILSFGIVTIYEALFISMDTFGYYVNYLETQDWINERIAQKNSELIETKKLEPGVTSGQIVRNQKTFNSFAQTKNRIGISVSVFCTLAKRGGYSV